MTGREIVIDGRKAAYWEGETSGPVVLLVHGFGGNHLGLADLAAALSPNFRVISVDLPGFGESAPMDRVHSLQNYAKFLNQFCAKLELGRCDVVGHSFGASVAIVMAARFPHRLRKLVLAMPVTVSNRWLGRLATFYYRLAGFTTGRLRHFLLNNHLLTWITDNALFATESKKRRAQILSADYQSDHTVPDRVTTESYQSLAATPLLRLARRIKAQTMVLAGTQDLLVPVDQMKVLAALVPEAHTVTVHGGHFFPIEAPKQAAEIIQTFLV